MWRKEIKKNSVFLRKLYILGFLHWTTIELNQMTFQEALNQLFSFDSSSQGLAFGFILLLSFLLGLLFWWLIVQRPQKKRYDRKLAQLNEELLKQRKEQEEAEDKLQVLSAELRQLQVEERKREKALAIQTKMAEDLGAQEKSLKQAKLAAEQAKKAAEQELEELKKLYKHAQRESLGAKEAEALAEEIQAKAQKEIDSSKALMQQIEEEREALLRQYEEQKSALHWAEEELEMRKSEIEDLQTELGQALNELAAKEAQPDILAEENEQLKEAFEELESRIKQLDQFQEETLPEDPELDQKIDELLQIAEVAMADAHFYEEIPEASLVEDEELLNEKLAGISLDKKEEEAEFVVELEVEEVAALEEALAQAESSMQMSGFFEAFDEAVILEADNSETLSEEEQMQAALELAAANMEVEQEEVEFIEDMAKLEEQLAQVPEEAPKTRALATSIEISEEEATQMEEALSRASESMQAEGFFAPMDESSILGEEELSIEEKAEEALLMAQENAALEQAEEEVVEDMAKLEEQLALLPKEEPMARGVALKEEEIFVDEGQALEMQSALQLAESALSQEGFYGSISEDELLGEEEKDDLSKIEGMSPAWQAKLEEAGVHSYQEIVHLSYQAIAQELNISQDLLDQWAASAKKLLV